MPLVSVVIPTYKHRDLVLATLESVFAQSFSDYEVIVVNDGSPDDTVAVLQPLADAGRIRYIEQPNAGQAAARNRGLAEARGEFVAFLDDDDLWPPDKLAWQVDALSAAPDAVLVYGYPQVFGDATVNAEPPEEMPFGNVKRQFLGRNWIVSPGQALLRTSAVRSVGGFDSGIWGADDWDLYICLADHGSFLYAAKEALCYRKHAANASADWWKMYLNLQKVKCKHLGSFPRLQTANVWFSCDDFVKRLASDQSVWAAISFDKKQERSQAREAWLTAVRVRPGALKDRYILFHVLMSLLPPSAASFCKSIKLTLSGVRK